MRFDTIIKNGKIVDGTSNPWEKFDLGIIGDQIIQIGRSGGSDANRIIDAENLVVTHGFIDIHIHSDILVLVEHARVRSVGANNIVRLEVVDHSEIFFNCI